MNSKKALTLLIAVCLLVIVGCQKKTEPVAPPAPATEANTIASAEIEQTMCPVMEGPIDKDIFVEYQGKKVYFCCAQCKGEFEKDPEKYIAKLPQFKK
ncbi:MAG: YHS domain-containing protein [Phycisphaerae bacterium]|jgi:YHS domain-containing protein